MARFGKRVTTAHGAGGSAGGPATATSSTWLSVFPARFDAVGEALADADGERVWAACWVVGHDLANAGTSLGESIEGLRSTTQLVVARDPTFVEMQALTVAWSEATLSYLHGLSCVDPLTGLSSMAHLRDHLAGLYRDQRTVARTHALVVIEVPPPAGLEPLAATRRLAQVGATARGVFAGSEVIGRVGSDRVIAVVGRDQGLGQRVTLLRRMLPEASTRVWIEGLPESDAAAAWLLDELARGD